jgi:hypothetical protein
MGPPMMGRPDGFGSCRYGGGETGMDYVALLYNWQSLAAGLLGLAAGVIAYIGAIRAAHRQVAALKEQIEDARTARRLVDERRLSQLEWAIRAEGTRLHAAVLALRGRALPSAPQAAARRRQQLLIDSSPLLRGEWDEISLLNDQRRARLEEVAGILDEYNLRIQTAPDVGLGPNPLIDHEILALVDRLAVAVQELRSIV